MQNFNLVHNITWVKRICIFVVVFVCGRFHLRRKRYSWLGHGNGITTFCNTTYSCFLRNPILINNHVVCSDEERL